MFVGIMVMRDPTNPSASTCSEEWVNIDKISRIGEAYVYVDGARLDVTSGSTAKLKEIALALQEKANEC